MSKLSWSWRHAFAKEEMPSTTKLVLHTIGMFMDETGRGSYPTTKQIAQLASLSERAVITHIQNAIDCGWLISKVHGFRGQKWKNHEYEANWPAEYGDGKGTERHSISDEKALNVIQEGTEPDDKKALNEVQSKASYTASSKASNNLKGIITQFVGVISEERIAAVIEHRRAIKKPLTVHAAKLLAGKFGQCADPDAAADAMVLNGWQGFDPSWLDRKPKQHARQAGGSGSVVSIAMQELRGLQDAE